MAARAGGTAVFALLAGGGTGGHVYPALALADELQERGHARDAIRFVGAARGLEARAVPAAGYAIDLLPARGLRRGRSWRALVENARTAGVMTVAVVRALRIVVRDHPRVVVSVGGYASVPGIVAAWVRRVPMVIHEQNAVPGLANRLAVRLGARAAVSLPGTALEGAVLTGNPVRAAVVAVHRAPDRDRPVVAVVGGSLGSARLNDAALELYDRWRDRTDVEIRLVAGPRYVDDCAARLAGERRGSDRLRFEVVGYEEHIEDLYARAALVVCRSGAVTVAELAAAGVPAVLVPWPGAADDHQSANARVMAGAGAAVHLPDAECTGARLAEVVTDLLADPARLATMGAAARAVARPDAAGALATLVEEVARAA
jgi:UDP-N-acetylglucosamine--N-acetylmuramyl-(pentapeptide) pyrophosphoryl-undecaprenol N-acetylglucosamine transferase